MDVKQFVKEHKEEIVKIGLRVALLSIVYRAGYRAGAKNALDPRNLSILHFVDNAGKEFIILNGRLLKKIK